MSMNIAGCRLCKSRVGLRLVFPRIRWGKAVRQGGGTGFSKTVACYCHGCRTKKRGAWKYVNKTHGEDIKTAAPQ